MAKKCPKTGKTKYFDEEEAKKGMTFIWGNDPSIKMGDLHIYRCDHPQCGALHIGHVRGKKKNNAVI